jgi:hypothetical protein
MTAIRHFRKKKEVLVGLKKVTPVSFGTPTRKLVKRYWKTKKGWTGSVKVR